VHRWIGYGIAVLVAGRIVWGIVGSRYARFRSFPPSLGGALAQAGDMVAGRKRVHLGHTPLGALMIYNLILTLCVIAGSGYAMTTFAYWGVQWVKSVHETSVLWAEVSVVLHVIAVIWESLRTGVNLPRAMVTGIKQVPDERLISE
jgi:cytochrome b